MVERPWKILCCRRKRPSWTFTVLPTRRVDQCSKARKSYSKCWTASDSVTIISFPSVLVHRRNKGWDLQSLQDSRRTLSDDSMDFSEQYAYTGPTPCYSPDGQYVACAQEQRVVVREVDNLQMHRIVSCLDKVQRIDWCSNSTYLLCSMPNRAQLWSMRDPEWSCKIDEGAAGVRNCMWAPDGLSVLVVADFQIRISIISLVDSSVKVMRGPKFADQGIAFSPDGRLLAYAERTDCKEYVSLVSCSSWELHSRIAITTQDLADLAWSPDSSCFVVWDTMLTYKLLVYSSEGLCLASFSAYQDALGIRSLRFSPNGQMLAIGSFDQEVRILANTNWRPLATLEHRSILKDEATKIVAYQEVDESSSTQRSPGKHRSRYIVCEMPLRIQTLKAPLDKANPALGVGHVTWSADGLYLASRNKNMPQAVFIWSAQTLELVSVLVQAMPVRACVWDPKNHRLIICTGGTKVYLWSPDGASCVHIPLTAFNASAAAWARDGDALLLADRDTFCCAYVGFTNND